MARVLSQVSLLRSRWRLIHAYAFSGATLYVAFPRRMAFRLEMRSHAKGRFCADSIPHALLRSCFRAELGRSAVWRSFNNSCAFTPSVTLARFVAFTLRVALVRWSRLASSCVYR